MTTNPIELDPPRWPGGPPICPVVNLPAFTGKAAAMAFRDANAPGSNVKRIWLCTDCGMVHYEATPIAVSGTTAGKHERPPYKRNKP